MRPVNDLGYGVAVAPERAGSPEQEVAPSGDPAKQAAALLYDYILGAETHERMHAACEAVGVSPPVAKALLLLEPGVAKPMRVLAAEWHCDASWVTTLVDGLEERAFAERRVHPNDRRVRTIELTPLGVKTRGEFLDQMHEPPAGFAALTTDEVVALRDILRKVLDASS